MSIVAAGVAFYAFLAVFPALAGVISLYGLLADPMDVQRQLASLDAVLPASVIALLDNQLRSLTARSQGSLGLGAALGLLLALWSANKGMKAVIRAINIAYDEPEERGFVRLNALSLLLTLGAMLLLVFSTAAVVVVPAILGRIGLRGLGEHLVTWGRWPVLALLMMGALSVVYRFAPQRTAPKWRWVSIGAVLATVLWLAASALFSAYVANFTSFDRTYGSVAVGAILLVWLFIGAYLVLFGAEVNAEIERRGAVTDRPARARGPRRGIHPRVSPS